MSFRRVYCGAPIICIYIYIHVITGCALATPEETDLSPKACCTQWSRRYPSVNQTVDVLLGSVNVARRRKIQLKKECPIVSRSSGRLKYQSQWCDRWGKHFLWTYCCLCTRMTIKSEETTTDRKKMKNYCLDSD